MGYWDENLFNVLDHMTKMASRPIYGKKFKYLLQNQEAGDLWYTASGTQELPNLIK